MTTCASILSELGAVETAANSINGKLDNLISRVGQVEQKIDNLDSRFNAIEAAFQTINNSIDELGNTLRQLIESLAQTIQSAIQGLFDLIRSLLGGNGNDNDRTDEILAEIRELRQLVIDVVVDSLLVLARNLNLYFDQVNSNINSGFDNQSYTLGRILDCVCNDSDINDIKNYIRELFDSLDGRISEKLVTVQDTIRRESNENEEKIDRILTKLDDDNPDWLNRILSGINGLLNVLNLLRNKECDLEPIREDINSCCSYLSGLVLNINFSPEFNTINQAIQGNRTILNNLNQDTDTIIDNLNTTNQNLTTNLQNITNNIQNITNEINYTINQGDTTNTTELTTNIDNIINQNNQIIQTLSTPPGTVELVSIDIQIFVRCNEDGEPEFDTTQVFVPKGREETERLKFNKLAQIEAIKCKPAVALVPEWWQVRLEGGIPQFIIAFGEIHPGTGKCLHATYAMTIPHFQNVKPLTCPVPRYKKGNYELIAYLRDNSKIIINAFNEYECERVYNSILPWIEPDWRSGIKYKIGQRRNYDFKEIWVCPRFGKYFSSGNRNMNPDWVTYFSEEEE